MKKSYTKPQLWAESFQASDAVAGPCDIDVGFSDTGVDGHKVCGYDHPNFGGHVKLFVDIHNDVCNMVLEEGNDKGCYHTAVDGSKYFGS